MLGVLRLSTWGCCANVVVVSGGRRNVVGSSDKKLVW